MTRLYGSALGLSPNILASFDVTDLWWLELIWAGWTLKTQLFSA